MACPSIAATTGFWQKKSLSKALREAGKKTRR
jgi:hypothetical protein